MKLAEAWNERSKLYAEGDKLWAEGDKLYAEGYKLRAEGDKLYAEGNKLRAEGNLLYVEAVIELYGPKALIDWETGKISGKTLPIPWSDLTSVVL